MHRSNPKHFSEVRGAQMNMVQVFSMIVKEQGMGGLFKVRYTLPAA
jgi:hypothetical protein